MKKILILALQFCFVVAEDEFFEPGVNIGGYGEMHYTNSVNPDSDDDPTIRLDFHRWILFVNYNFTPEWSLKSEVELEHNMVGGSYGGYMELEQAYINYHNADKMWGFGAGTMLISSGIINETHEPPTFLSVERPSYNSKIIPTTWFGNGFMAYKSFGDIHAKFILHEDMNGLGMVNDDADRFDGLRGGRAKGYKSTAYHWTKNMSMHWTGMKGLNIGGSYTFGGAPTGLGTSVVDDDMDTDDLSDDTYVAAHGSKDYVDWNLMELHAQYDANNIVFAFEYGMTNFSHVADNMHIVDITPAVEGVEGVEDSMNCDADGVVGAGDLECDNAVEEIIASDEMVSFSELVVPDASGTGYYFHLGYNVGSLLREDCKLVPWFGMESYDVNDSGTKVPITHTKIGITWWPTNKISFKMDYDMKDDNDKKSNTLSMGVGYMF